MNSEPETPDNPEEISSAAVQPPWRISRILGFGVLVLVAFFVAQIAAPAAMIIFGGMDTAGRLGDITTVAVIASSALCTGLIVFALSGRYSPVSYLALRPVGMKTFGGWLLLTVGFVLLGDRVIEWLDRPVVPDFMLDVYTTARFMPVLWFAMIVAAPVFEEVFFRGFLFEGLRHTSIGVTGAILIPTLVWTLLHASQYDVFYLSLIIIIGLLLGVARHFTGSLYVPIAMHMTNNLIATIQTMWATGS